MSATNFPGGKRTSAPKPSRSKLCGKSIACGVSGGGKANAHYEGYKALPSGNGDLSDDQIADTVLAAFIAAHSGFKVQEILANRENFVRAYKQAAGKLHPDNKATGDNGAFLHLQKIKTLLEKNFT